jgi:hypothetical protein
MDVLFLPESSCLIPSISKLKKIALFLQALQSSSMLLAILLADDSLGVDELVVNRVVFAALSYLARRCG